MKRPSELFLLSNFGLKVVDWILRWAICSALWYGTPFWWRHQKTWKYQKIGHFFSENLCMSRTPCMDYIRGSQTCLDCKAYASVECGKERIKAVDIWCLQVACPNVLKGFKNLILTTLQKVVCFSISPKSQLILPIICILHFRYLKSAWNSWSKKYSSDFQYDFIFRQ